MERRTSIIALILAVLALVLAVVALVLVLILYVRGLGPAPVPPPTSSPTALIPPTFEATSTASPPPSPTGTSTPTPRPTPMPLRPNPLVLTRTGDLEASARTVVDGIYCTPAWTGTAFPSILSLPVEPVNGDLLLEWNSAATNDYISLPGNPTYGIPADYTIATSSDSTNGRDGTWREVVHVTGNTARTRAHRFPFAGARWVRMTVTAAVPGPLGNTFAVDEIDLRDASNGTDDTVFFLGDSITAAGYKRCPAIQPSYAALVHQAFPRWFPAMIDGGVGGVNSGYGASVVQDWLSLNPDFHVWAIGYGTNDAWEHVSPADYEANLQSIVDHIYDAGRVAAIARIPYAVKGPTDAEIRALNDVVDRVTARNGLVRGPDLYAWFSAHPDEIGPDGVHPSDVGSKSINRLWYEALRSLYK